MSLFGVFTMCGDLKFPVDEPKRDERWRTLAKKRPAQMTCWSNKQRQVMKSLPSPSNGICEISANWATKTPPRRCGNIDITSP